MCVDRIIEVGVEFHDCMRVFRCLGSLSHFLQICSAIVELHQPCRTKLWNEKTEVFNNKRFTVWRRHLPNEFHQSLFALGYYQELAALWAGKEDDTKEDK